MSEFQYCLSAAQLTKHYEVLQFLTQHPNQAYTLAQLDALLPHGVAIQRFPEKWFDLIEDGACWHRSIELHRPAPEKNPDRSTGSASSALSSSSPSGPDGSSRTASRTQYVLSCVKSDICTLDELRSRLESPSTLLDTDACVALHTDQIVLAPQLLLRAQRTGLAYYFPDVYDKNEFRQFGVRDLSSSSPVGSDPSGTANVSGGGRATAGQATSALLESFMNRDEDASANGKRNAGGSASGGGSRSRTYISLPSGVRVQHQLLTRRGVPEQEDHCVPTKIYVGEVLRLVLDNAVAVRKLGQANELKVELSMAGVKPDKRSETFLSSGSHALNESGRPDVLATELPPPLRIRNKAQFVRHASVGAVQTPATAFSASSSASPTLPATAPPPLSSSSAAGPMGPPLPTQVSTTTRVEIEALYACTLTLLLRVNGVENVLPVELLDDASVLPGVLILRDRQLDSFAMPGRDLLNDPVVNPPVSAQYPYESLLPALSPAEKGASATAAQQHQPQTNEGAWTDLVPLPWTQNPSPVVLSLREATFPTLHATVQAATRAVFSAHSLADEARLRQTKERLRTEAEARAMSGGGADGKRKRVPYRRNVILSNRHLLHFGLDFSIPFMKQQQQE